MDSNSLDWIACTYGTDKSTRSQLPAAEDGYSSRPSQGHGYTIYYEHYFGKLRQEPIRLLEIGVLDGKSLATWADFYSRASIFGLDIDPACRRFEAERTRIFTGSQADPVLLAEICAAVPDGFDIIIDDGSHYVRHMIASFGGLFDHLKPGGTYVIEDIHVADWRGWGQVAFNKGMDMQRDGGGNDPEELIAFLFSVRQRPDVAELIVHLRKICFIRKASGDPLTDRAPWQRGDRIEDLFPPPKKRTLAQKVARRLVGEY